MRAGAFLRNEWKEILMADCRLQLWKVLLSGSILFLITVATSHADDDMNHPALTRRHLLVIRNLIVRWVDCESGGPGFSLFPSGSEDAQAKKESEIAKRIREILGSSELGENEALTIYREALEAVAFFVHHASLPPGKYSFRLPFPISESQNEPYLSRHLVELNDDVVTVEITKELLALLAKASVRFFDDEGLDISTLVDCKRPYGEMSYYYIDVGNILKVAPAGPFRKDHPELREFTEQQKMAFEKLHFLTEPALQVFLRKAEISLGMLGAASGTETADSRTG